MSLQQLFTNLLNRYVSARTESFTGHPMGGLVRDSIKRLIGSHISESRYLVKGSVGQGAWAEVPWVGIFDELVTTTAQDGFYVVYLIKADCSGFYLSINQGVTSIRTQYGADSKRALSTRAKDFAARLKTIPAPFTADPISLTSSTDSSSPVLYQNGNICSVHYSADAIPDDATLLSHLDQALELYRELYLKERPSSVQIDVEDDEDHYEDRTKIRIHKRIERNHKLSKKVKALKGLKCEACGFAYSDMYRGIDCDYIEAHHLTPFSQLEEKKVPLDPRTDFAVLCSNCHRMIHRSEFVSDVKGFVAHHLKKTEARA